jgi:ElaA protein
MKLNYQFKHFYELSASEFHDLLAVRLKAFVVEQNCSYLDLDGKDKKCYHAICRDGKGNIVATARVIPPGISYQDSSIGRVVIDENYRGEGLGHELMTQCVDFIFAEFGKVPIRISAQKYLERFYNVHLFFSIGKEYLEDGIPHLEMLYSPIM